MSHAIEMKNGTERYQNTNHFLPPSAYLAIVMYEKYCISFMSLNLFDSQLKAIAMVWMFLCPSLAPPQHSMCMLIKYE